MTIGIHILWLSCDIGCPQGCVVSPILFSVYTDFIKSNCDNVKIFKYADDRALIGLLNFKQPTISQNYFEAIQILLSNVPLWILFLTQRKTKKMVVNFCKSCALYEYIFINGNSIEKVDSFKYLGSFFNCDLKWCSNTEYFYSKL